MQRQLIDPSGAPAAARPLRATWAAPRAAAPRTLLGSMGGSSTQGSAAARPTSM